MGGGTYRQRKIAAKWNAPKFWKLKLGSNGLITNLNGSAKKQVPRGYQPWHLVVLVKFHALANTTKSMNKWKGLGNPHIHFNTQHVNRKVSEVWSRGQYRSQQQF
jgi:hypothetical protein